MIAFHTNLQIRRDRCEGVCCLASSDMKKIKRYRLAPPLEYITALEEVLGVRLDDEFVRTRDGKKYFSEIAQAVSELTKGLTKERDEFLSASYLHNDSIRKAYLLYYTTTNFLKPYIPLQELFHGGLGTADLRVLDLGAGTGAASLGLLYFLEQYGFNGTVELHLVDAVKKNLDEASRMITAYSRKLPFTVVHHEHHGDISTSDLPLKDAFDLLLMMNTLNELQEENDSILLSYLFSLLNHEGSCVLVEPAARPSSRRLLRLRNKAVESGYTVYSPCTRQSTCPALIKEDDWCHTEIEWDRPSIIRSIDDEVGTLRLSLKYSYIILNSNGDTLSHRLGQGHLSRVVSEIFLEKGRIRLNVCSDSGRIEHIMNKRDISLSNKVLEELHRFDLIKMSRIEVREHDNRVTHYSEIDIVLPILGARY